MRKTNLPNLIFETGSLLEKCRINITVIRERMTTLEGDPLPTEIATLLYANRLRLLGLALMTGIFLSCIHRSLLGEPLRLSSESSQWSNEIFHLSEIAVQFQPLGAMAMLLCLNAAWIGTPSEEMREAIKSLIVDYEMACYGRPSVRNMTAALESTERRFTLVVEEP